MRVFAARPILAAGLIAFSVVSAFAAADAIEATSLGSAAPAVSPVPPVLILGPMPLLGSPLTTASVSPVLISPAPLTRAAIAEADVARRSPPVPAAPVLAPTRAPSEEGGTAAKPKIDLDQIEYEQARDVVGLILKDYAPAGHFFIGVGRSPAIFVAILKNLDPDMAGSLPLSSFYHHPEGRESYREPLSKEVEGRLFDHFERFIPEDVLSGERPLVLIDWVKGGRSMVALDDYLKVFARERHPRLKWDFVGLGYDEPHPGFDEAGRSYRMILPSAIKRPGVPTVLYARMDLMWNKEAQAEYGAFPAPFEGSASLAPNPRFAAWRARLAERMAADAVMRALRGNVSLDDD